MSRRPSAARDSGSVTAEIAVGMPAVVLVLAACLGSLGLGTAHVQAQDAAADAARLLGRGETLAAAQGHVARSMPGARLAVDYSEDLVCTTVTVERPVLLVPVGVSGASCALDGGR
jgi:hypothetical protein